MECDFNMFINKWKVFDKYKQSKLTHCVKISLRNKSYEVAVIAL